MLDSLFDLIRREARTKFENFEVVWAHNSLQRSPIDNPRTWRPVVASRKFNVVHVKAIQTIAQTVQMHEVMDEPKVLFDLRVTGVVPINDGGRLEFFEEERKIRFERNLF